MAEDDLQQIERRRQIDVFAEVLISEYGFSEEVRAGEVQAVRSALLAGEVIDYDALRERADRDVRENQMRWALSERGLAEDQIDRFLRDFPENAS